MFSKSEIRNMRWKRVETSRLIIWFPYEAKIGDVCFVGDVNSTKVINECKITKKALDSDFPAAEKSLSRHYTARLEFCTGSGSDYYFKDTSQENTAYYCVCKVCGNPEIDNDDFN